MTEQPFCSCYRAPIVTKTQLAADDATVQHRPQPKAVYLRQGKRGVRQWWSRSTSTMVTPSEVGRHRRLGVGVGTRDLSLRGDNNDRESEMRELDN
ncbi:hypothetical protein L6452_33513 [Arctium lappa]|uniref:Uncharacterized protein n=1 Tax=Arctium lappa TaxID=4217 RepID=A0ACB8YF07_ARCLA|nr:hypothetical protein L6452_33513 [Arctium lappa]